MKQLFLILILAATCFSGWKLRVDSVYVRQGVNIDSSLGVDSIYVRKNVCIDSSLTVDSINARAIEVTIDTFAVCTTEGLASEVEDTIWYSRFGPMVTLQLNNDFSGTSDANYFRILGLPDAVMPDTNIVEIGGMILVDNGTQEIGAVQIFREDGDVTKMIFSLGGGGPFTSSGTKSLSQYQQIIYSLRPGIPYVAP